MKKLVGIGVVVLALILIMSGLAFARSMAFTDAECLIFRDTSGDELKLCGAADITAGTITYSTGSGSAVTTTGTETLTNKTLTAPVVTTGTFANPVITDGTDTQIYVVNSAGIFVPVTMSGDITITNAAVATIGNNKVGTAESIFNTVTLIVAAGVLFNTVEVETGSTFLGWRTGTEGVLANTSVFVNTVSYTDPDFRVSYSDEQADLPASSIIGTFMRP